LLVVVDTPQYSALSYKYTSVVCVGFGLDPLTHSLALIKKLGTFQKGILFFAQFSFPTFGYDDS